MKGRRADTAIGRRAKMLCAAGVAMLPILAACSDSGDSGGPEVPQSENPQADVVHGPFFPECGGVSDEEMTKQTQVAGLVNTAKTSVGCQWLVGGGVSGPHFSFSWYRGSPIGRERTTMTRTRTSVEDITIEGHDGFIGYSDTPTLGIALCEIGIQFDNDFIEWSVSFDRKPFPDACDVAKELTRQSIVNAT